MAPSSLRPPRLLLPCAWGRAAGLGHLHHWAVLLQDTPVLSPHASPRWALSVLSVGICRAGRRHQGACLPPTPGPDKVLPVLSLECLFSSPSRQAMPVLLDLLPWPTLPRPDLPQHLVWWEQSPWVLGLTLPAALGALDTPLPSSRSFLLPPPPSLVAPGPAPTIPSQLLPIMGMLRDSPLLPHVGPWDPAGAPKPLSTPFHTTPSQGSTPGGPSLLSPGWPPSLELHPHPLDTSPVPQVLASPPRAHPTRGLAHPSQAPSQGAPPTASSPSLTPHLWPVSRV